MRGDMQLTGFGHDKNTLQALSFTLNTWKMSIVLAIEVVFMTLRETIKLRRVTT